MIGDEFGIIDAAVAHGWEDQTDATRYMPAGWQEYIGTAGRFPNGGGAITILPRPPYPNPLGDDTAPEDDDASANPGRLAADVRQTHLNRHGISLAVLTHREALAAGAIPNPHMSREVCRAANEWTAEHWLRDGPRDFFALVLVSAQDPPSAVREIERWAASDRIVGIALGANSLGRPFGHPVYHPIHEAADHFGLPLVVQAGMDVLPNSISHPTAAGLPSSYSEYHSLRAQSVMTSIASFVVQGVFDRFPNLRLVASGVGTTWLPPFLWRFDTEYGSHVRENPWMQMRPSEYVRQFITVTTHGTEWAARPRGLSQLLSTIDYAADILMFGSGYPNWDSSDPASVAALLPSEWRQRVLRDNALSVFRWPSDVDVRVG